ncbi:ATP-binding protein [Spirillospora sp. CA-294931]|uniref:ATP-binding protein n=1 Tax=Spirillospora sp. CA-294931 TaxID=3240042 RepID=UPI003D94B6EA
MAMETTIPTELNITCLAARTAPMHVRTLLGFQLSNWGLENLLQDASLVIGELIANAIEATPHGEIRVRITREAESITLGVWDSSDSHPVAKPVVELDLADITPDARALDPGHDDGTGGWGLPIVEALSAEYGLRPTPPHGKWVWTRLRARPTFAAESR